MLHVWDDEIKKYDLAREVKNACMILVGSLSRKKQIGKT